MALRRSPPGMVPTMPRLWLSMSAMPPVPSKTRAAPLVASRSSEIAVLLTLGFHPRSILASFLAESTLIAVVGGVVGGLLALPVNGVVASTTNWASFSEIAFSFRVTPGLLLAGVIFAAAMGLLGGFFPARRASKLQVVEAIRR